MRIAVIGAGFCGLAIAWNLAQDSQNEVVVFDSKQIGMGTSGIAAGLLHGYVGAHSNRNPRASEALQATLELIQIAELALEGKISKANGIFRPAVTTEQISYFKIASEKYSDIHWRIAEECTKNVPCMQPLPGIFIDSGLVVDCQLYLQGLWKACATLGAQFELKKILSVSELHDFDRIFIAIGADTKSLPETAHLPIKVVKGQVLEFKWPKDLAPLPYPVNSQAYVLMNPSGASCVVGATYEKVFSSCDPDIEAAINEIMPKINAFMPHLTKDAIIDCRAGQRAVGPKHQPLLQKLNDRFWVLSGMGSKGLLYHALYAKELVCQAFN